MSLLQVGSYLLCEFYFALQKAFLKDSSPEETPLGAYIQSVRKLKEQRKQLIEQS